uniref:Retrovirus-related Pol polyprotein from transposon gypsy n=1 Tax=Bactrocera dorsalis TaxID=27457 RepID=A0A034VW72_BACDO
MDIFYINGKSYLSSIDRFTKYAYFRKLGSKLHFHEIIEEVLSQIFPNCTELMTDNESIFVGIGTTALLNKLQIKHEKTANNHSTSNAQVERLHSTILEIARTLANDRTTTTEEEIFSAVKEYNRTIHSVIKEKPVDLFFNQKEINEKVKNNIEKNQERMLEYHNKKRSQKDFKPVQIIYEKSSRRQKYNKRYIKHIVKENKENTVLTTKNKLIHKDNIRNVLPDNNINNSSEQITTIPNN